jgi:hypothetical protein
VIKKIIFSFLLYSVVVVSAPLKLTAIQEQYIATKVWTNEGAGLDKYLVHWNDGEDFASLGIGHFIWFPAGHTEKFREVFPMVLCFMEEQKTVMPIWLNSKTPFPWNSKKEFFDAKARNDKQYIELFDFIKSTTNAQASFLANRLNLALPMMLATINDKKQANIIKDRFNSILYNKNGTINEHGLYILIDYVNFKGEGTLESERYNNQGWGLLQVLENMDYKNQNKFLAFSNSAKAMLSRRIANSPKLRGEERWRIGWNKRLDTYVK